MSHVRSPLPRLPHLRANVQCAARRPHVATGAEIPKVYAFPHSYLLPAGKRCAVPMLIRSRRKAAAARRRVLPRELSAITTAKRHSSSGTPPLAACVRDTPPGLLQQRPPAPRRRRLLRCPACWPAACCRAASDRHGARHLGDLVELGLAVLLEHGGQAGVGRLFGHRNPCFDLIQKFNMNVSGSFLPGPNLARIYYHQQVT